MCVCVYVCACVCVCVFTLRKLMSIAELREILHYERNSDLFTLVITILLNLYIYARILERIAQVIVVKIPGGNV